MRVRASDLDRHITFQENARTQDPVFGTSVTSWQNIATDPTVPARVQDVLPSRAETVADGISLNRRPAKVWIRYRDDITADMRIVYEGRNMRIVGSPAEIGRKQGLEFMVEEYSTEGDAV